MSDRVELEFEAVGADKVIDELEEYEKAITNLEKVSDVDLSKIVDGLEGVGDSADTAIKPVEELSKAFEDVESSADSAGSGLEAIVSSFEQGTSASEGLNTAVTETGAGFEQFSSSAETGSGSLQTLVASFEEGTSASGTLNTEMAQLPGVIDDTSTASAGLSTELQTTGESFNTVNESATETTAVTTEAGAAFTEYSGVATEAAAANTEFTTSTVELGTGIGDAVAAIEEENSLLGEFNTVTTEAATASTEAATSQAELATSMEETATAAESSASGLETFNTNIADSVGFFGNAASGAIGLVQGFVRLDQMQNRVQRSTVGVSKAQEALEKAQAKLNTLQASGTASAGDLANAQRDVEQASASLEQKQGALEIQQQNLNLRMTEFYATIGPNIIQTTTGIIAGIGNLPTAISNITGVIARLGGSLRGTSGEVNLYTGEIQNSEAEMDTWGHGIQDTDMQINTFGNDVGTTAGGLVNLTKTSGQAGKSFAGLGQTIGIVGLVIGTAAVALGVITNNTFGARDALNAFGESVGNAIPPLEGILVAVQNFAVDVGIAGDDAKATVTKFEELGTVTEQLTAHYQKMAAELKASSDTQAQAVGKNIDTMIQKSEEHATTVETTSQASADSWKKFTDALADQRWSDAVDAGIEHITTSWDGFLQAHGTRNEAMAAGWEATISNMALSFRGWIGEHKQLSDQMVADQKSAYEIIGGLANELFVVRLGGFFAEGLANIQVKHQATVSQLTAQWGTFTQSVDTAVADVVASLNSISGQVQNQAQALWDNSGLGEFFDKAINTAVNVANTIAEVLIPKGGTPAPEIPAGQPGGQGPRQQAPRPEGQAPATAGAKKQFDASDAIAATTTAVQQLTPALNQANTSFGSFNVQQLQAAAAAESARSGFSGIAGASSLTSTSVKSLTPALNTTVSGLGSLGASATTTAQVTGFLTGNFQRARALLPAFNQALIDSKNVVSELPPQWQAYGQALQTADDAGIALTQSVAGSVPATIAAAGAIENLTGKREAELGAAVATIGVLAPEADIRGMSNNQILDYAANLELSKAAIDAERNSRVANTRESLKQQSVENVSNALIRERAESYIGLNGVLGENLVANQAIIDEFQPLNQGMVDQNNQVRAVQQAYSQMTDAKVNNIVSLQKEAQALALNNILQEGSQRATIALAVAQTEGVNKGVEFANAQFTAQASLSGYRAALSEAISGNTEYGNSLGLTTRQLEQALTFQNDVVAAQEAIIDVGAEVVHTQTVQAEAWRTMSQEQLNNLNIVNQARIALTSLNSPLADNAANIQALNEAFIAGREAANNFMLGLRTTSAESAGYKQRLNELIPAQNQVGNTAEYTTEQMERLASAFSGTSQSLREMTGAMIEAASSFIGMLKFDPEELHTKINDAFKDVPDWIRDTMSRELQGGIVAQGDIERLGKQFVDMTGAAIVGAFRTDNPFEQLRPFAEKMLETFDELDPQVAAALEPMKKHFEDIKNLSQLNLPPTVQQLQELGQAFVGLAVEAEKARDPFASLYQEMGGIQNITPQMAANIATLDGGLKSLSEQGVGASLGLAEIGTQAAAGQVPMVELKNTAGEVVGQFANVNGTLIPVNQGLSALVPASQLAGNALLGVGTFANAVVIRFGDIQEAVALTGTAFSLLTNIIGIGFGNVMAVLGAHVTTLNTYFGITIPVALMATQNAWVLFSTTFVNNFAIMISMAALHVTTLSTYFTVTIPVALMATQNAWVLFSTTFINNFAIMVSQAALHVTTLNTYFTTTIPVALMAAQNAWVQFSSTFLANFAAMISAAGQHVTTINTYFTQTIPNALTTGANAFTTSTNAMSTSVLTLRNNVQQAESDISSSFEAISSSASSMASDTTGSLNDTSTAALTLRNNTEQLASDFESAMQDMSTSAGNFANDFQTAMDHVISSAESATSAVEELQSAIDSLQDKTVTITVQYKEVGKPKGAQHGGSFIVDQPTTFGGVRMGEYHKPELVTVMPLTNPNRNYDRSIDLGRLSSATEASQGMQRGGAFIRVRNHGGDNDMVNKLIAEVRNLKGAMEKIRIYNVNNIDGRSIDQVNQIRRARRIEQFNS